MNKTNDFKFNLPGYTDAVDVEDLNDNFRGIDDALMAGLCKKDYTGNNMGSSDPSARKYAWAPWLEIVNNNEFDVVVTDRNAPVESEEATINIAAGQTFRKYINGRYYMNFYVQDQHDVTFKWFTNAETYINESGGGGGGTGTVTSVSVQGGSGSHLTGSGNPIETSGIITINVDEGYSIPSDNEQTAWDGKAADLKAEIDSSTYVLTLQLKDSSGNLIGNERTIDLPLESVVVSGTYDDQTKKVILTLQNGSTIEFSVADLVSGLQTELSASNKLDPAYIDYDSSHRAVSDTEKDTWSGKQNAISDLETIRSGATAGATAVQPSAMQTALAGKQDSLDQTQLAAVNSGIDSTKVAQISTNQTNILYAINTGVKNIINVPDQTQTNGTTVQVTDGVVKVTGTIASNAVYTILEHINLKAGTYYLSGGIGGTAGENFLRLGTQATDAYIMASYSNTPSKFTLNNDTECKLSVYTQGTNLNLTYYPMISILSDDEYVPYALPNYDLTRLESEDRAGLVECVDGGAKNVFTGVLNSVSDTNYSITRNSDNTYTIQITGTLSGDVYQNLEYNIGSKYVGYVLSAGGNADICVAISNSGGGVAVSTQNNATPIITSEATNRVFIYLKAGTTAQTITLKPMICTKAAFGISKAFVPYRPNYQALVDKTTEQTFGIFKYNNNYSINTVTRKCNGFAWFTLSATSTANIAANTNTIIAYVDGDVQPVGGSTDRFIFTARVNTDPPSLLHSHIRGGDGYIYINSPTAIPAGTSISITGSYKY